MPPRNWGDYGETRPAIRQLADCGPEVMDLSLGGLFAAGVEPGVLGWVEYGVFSGEFLGGRRSRGFRLASAQA